MQCPKRLRNVWVLDQKSLEGAAGTTGNEGKGIAFRRSNEHINVVSVNGAAHVSSKEVAVMNNGLT